MVEKAYAGHCHGDTEVIAAVDHSLIPYRAAGLGDILNAGAYRSFDVILKGEERVGAESNICHLFVPFFFFFFCKRYRTFGKISLPYAVFAQLLTTFSR